MPHQERRGRFRTGEPDILNIHLACDNLAIGVDGMRRPAGRADAFPQGQPVEADNSAADVKRADFIQSEGRKRAGQVRPPDLVQGSALENRQARSGIGARAFLWIASAKIGSHVRICCFSKAFASSSPPPRASSTRR